MTTTATETDTATTASCRVCGVATDRHLTRRATFTNYGRPTPAEDYDVGVCPSCASLDPDVPGLAVRAALRVLGKDEGDPLAAEAFADADVDVSAVLFDRGDPLGTRARAPQRKAFGHIDRDGRAALRAGYAALLALRVERTAQDSTPTVPTTPPEGAPRACLACGLGTSLAWFGPVLTAALTPGPEMVEGFLCDVCGPHLQVEGAVGLPFLERAVTATLGLDRPPTRLRAWVGTGLEPRQAPWDWVDTAPPPETLDPVTALFEEVAALRERVEALEADRG